MKKSLLLAVLFIGAALFLLRPRDAAPPSTPEIFPAPSPAAKSPDVVQKVSAPALPPPAVPPAASPPVVPAPRTLPPTGEDHPARVEAESIALNLRHYGQRFGGNPVGTNAEIVKTLNGSNPQGVRYLPQEHLRLNDQGELLDTWGTPYFFHQMSAQQMEIRSAGPDKTFWTRDDIIAQ